MAYLTPRIGRSLKLLREERGLRSKEVAEQAGLGASHYSEIENGRRNISTAVMEKLSVVFGLTTEDLRAAEGVGRGGGAAGREGRFRE